MKLWAVLGCFKNLESINSDINITLSGNDGMVGFIPLFKNIDDAIKFSEGRFEIMEMRFSNE